MRWDNKIQYIERKANMNQGIHNPLEPYWPYTVWITDNVIQQHPSQWIYYTNNEDCSASLEIKDLVLIVSPSLDLV